MTRNELSDVIFKYLYDFGKEIRIYNFVKRDYGIDDRELCLSIQNEMILIGLIKAPAVNTSIVRISSEGKILYEKYGSFTGYKNSLKKEAEEKNKKPFKDRYWWLIIMVTGIVSYIGGVFSPILTDMMKSKIQPPNIITPTVLKIDTLEIFRTDTIYLPDSLLKKKAN